MPTKSFCGHTTLISAISKRLFIKMSVIIANTRETCSGVARRSPVLKFKQNTLRSKQMKYNVGELAPVFQTMAYAHAALKSVYTGVMHVANPACVPQGTKLKETEYCSLICWIFLCLLLCHCLLWITFLFACLWPFICFPFWLSTVFLFVV